VDGGKERTIYRVFGVRGQGNCKPGGGGGGGGSGLFANLGDYGGTNMGCPVLGEDSLGTEDTSRKQRDRGST